MAIENSTLLSQISHKGKIASLVRNPRKEHKCSECPLPLEIGTPHYAITYAGAGLGGLKFPERVHVGACTAKSLGLDEEADCERD